MKSSHPWTDQTIENVVGNLLRVGVSLAAAVVMLGGAIYLARHWAEPVNYRIFRGEPAEYRSVFGIFHQVLAVRGRGIVQLGLLLLIATPVARVGFSAWAFFEERDRMYVGFTLIVLGVLLYSLLGSSAVVN
jgi:uncharacterized membrane protein